ncbi:hypothetical protein PspLS_10732 [Pyricularia sp. CBS 133598]|nr:hypothetical protein PspLS_10732 [Pyricularia sp. CBS 133598]
MNSIAIPDDYVDPLGQLHTQTYNNVLKLYNERNRDEAFLEAEKLLLDIRLNLFMRGGTHWILAHKEDVYLHHAKQCLFWWKKLPNEPSRVEWNKELIAAAEKLLEEARNLNQQWGLMEGDEGSADEDDNDDDDEEKGKNEITDKDKHKEEDQKRG